MPKTIFHDDWYNFPSHYELLTADETADQLRFVLGAFERYGTRSVRIVFEPGCGSGRLVRPLVAKGFQVYGFDTNSKSLTYLQTRLKRRGLRAQLFPADMANFKLPVLADAGYCLMNTFRHLLTEQAAESHLRSVLAALRVGGVYLLGLHVMPPDASDDCTERWTAQSGSTRASATLRVLTTDRRKRIEQIRMSLLVRRPKGVIRIRSEFPLRRYTLRQLIKLLDRVPEFELLEAFDFWYELDRPIQLTSDVSDLVLVLRKKRV